MLPKPDSRQEAFELETLPRNFTDYLLKMQQKIKDIAGHLSPRESKLLFFFASCPTTAGEILEIGSYRGKSTITQAKGAQLTGRAKIIAVDPLTSPSITYPKLVGDCFLYLKFPEPDI